MGVVNGLHHVTAIAGPAQENLDFYAGVLGMRLVKKSVNQDDPGTYHLFFADAEGSPGTDLTFFPWDLSAPRREGHGLSVEVSLTVPEGSLAFWGERLDGTYAFRTLLESGAVVANGSDAPVEELDPLAGIAAGVRRTIDDRSSWRPEEGLTVEQALHASTVAPAWLAGDERRRGRLLPGFLADLVVLDRDPLAVTADELPDVQVVATMVGGRWVHNPPPWD